MKNRTRLTAKDVAKEAGVSTATVSRALSRHMDVNETTRSHVFEVAKRLGYRGNQAAANLRTGRSKILLVLVSEITNAFFADFFKGVDEEARSSGYLVLIGDTSEDTENERAYSDMLLINQADGLILNTDRFPVDLWPSADSDGYGGPPLVSCAGYSDMDVPEVRIDDVYGGQMAGEHLVALRHTDIIQVCGSLKVRNFERRYNGFRNALKSAGVKVDDSRNYEGELSTDFGLQVAEKIAADPVRPTAVFVHNDETAIGVLHGLANAGIRVPEDISIVGYDDMPYAAVFNPGLTTVALPRREWGRLACRRLIAVLHDGDAADTSHTTIITPEFIARSSSGPAPKRS